MKRLISLTLAAAFVLTSFSISFAKENNAKKVGLQNSKIVKQLEQKLDVLNKQLQKALKEKEDFI